MISCTKIALCIGYRHQLAGSFGKRLVREVRASIHFSDCYYLRAAAGNRNATTGLVYNVGRNGNFWSSTQHSTTATNAFNLNVNSSGANPSNNNNRANGFLVRCVPAE